VNGKSVWHKTHEEIVESIASSEYRIHITVADNCFSDSSDDEQESNQNFRPKYPYSKSRSRDQFYHQESSFDGMPPSRFHTHPPLPHLQSRSVMNIPTTSSNNRNQDIANVSAMLKSASSSSKSTPSSAIIIQNGAETVSFSIIVGYLGTIEMPKQIATSTKLQTVRSCIRKLRQEKRSPTLVLMNILPNSLNLLNSNNVTLATYPSNRLNYISSSSDTNSKFFGLVTSATFQEDESRVQPVAISNSCHVFGVETKLIDHNAHLQTAEKFHIKCTKDLISNSCLEFPMTSDYICNIIKSQY
jgi:regulator of G-protein signaling